MRTKPYVPLRDWSTPSYSPDDGRAAKSSEQFSSGRYGAEGEAWSTNPQFPVGQPGKGSPSLKQLDAARTTNPTPVRKRPVG
jgi:hypothetical protein